jgi:YbbR domain-containing protein
MQQQRTINPNRLILDNLMWLVGSIALAFFVWTIATLQSDPIQEQPYSNIPVQIEHSEGLVVTDQSRPAVLVTVRAPRSIINQLSRDDIVVHADLNGLGAGTHRVNLNVETSRRASVDTSPRFITVTLETYAEQYKPVEALIVEAPPEGFQQNGPPLFETNQVLVSGPVSLVDQVEAVQVVLDLGEQRESLENSLRLTPVDVDGSVIDGVTLDPQTMSVIVPIQPRPDIREVRVTPNILAETLPEGYALTGYTPEPEIVVITGPPEALNNLPGTLFTEPIELTGRTGSFEQTAAVQLPSEELSIVGDETVNVSVIISPLLSSRQLDSINVEMIGLSEGLATSLVPSDVTVLVSGPQLMVEGLERENVRVSVDLEGLTEGVYQIRPDIVLEQQQSALPTTIDVVITRGEPSNP